MKLFFQIIFIQLILNVYVFFKGWRLLHDKKKYKIPFASVFIAELLLYLVGFFASESLPSYILKYIMIIGTSWAIFIIYMGILLLAFDLSKFIYIFISRKTNRKIIYRYNRQTQLLFYWICILLVILVMGKGYYNFKHPVVNEINLRIEKNVPGIEQFRIVMASDLHIGYMNDRGLLEMYIDKIMEQQPDIILLAGDIIDYNLKPLLEENMQEEIRRLSAPYGVYASLGNHDHYADEENKIRWLREETGITILQDSAVLVDDSFYIIGREDRKSPRKPLEELLQNVNKTLPVIILNHQPNNLDEEVMNGVDIAFYGHTHYGQIVPINIVTEMLYEVAAGYKKKGNTHLVVSSGLGIGGPQYRIGTDSELIVVNLTFGS